MTYGSRPFVPPDHVSLAHVAFAVESRPDQPASRLSRIEGAIILGFADGAVAIPAIGVDRFEYPIHDLLVDTVA